MGNPISVLTAPISIGYDAVSGAADAAGDLTKGLFGSTVGKVVSGVANPIKSIVDNRKSIFDAAKFVGKAYVTGGQSVVAPALAGIANRSSAFDNPAGHFVRNGLNDYNNPYYRNNPLNAIGGAVKNVGGTFDEFQGGPEKRAKEAALVAEQGAAQQKQLDALTAQKDQQTALEAGVSAQSAARRQQLNVLGSRRRSTILTGPLGIQGGGNSVGGVKGYGTLLGGS